jgi:uncharacterized protein
VSAKPKVPDEVAATLKSYVYVYTDPRDGEPFYVGKGKGSRLFSHLDDRAESNKVRRIAEIRAAGEEPLIDILRYGLSDGEARLVEAAAIDLLGKASLTNTTAGFHTGSFGRVSSRDLIAITEAKPVVVRHNAILITINRLYRSDMTPRELLEATRGIWKVGAQREKVDYAMAVYQGVVREVYRIHHPWLPAGKLEYLTRDDIDARRDSGRWEFDGEVAEKSVRSMYKGRSVGKGGQNPIRYVLGEQRSQGSKS